MEETLKEAVRQFPMVGIVLGVIWFAWRQYSKQQDKHETASKEERSAFLDALKTTTDSCHAHQEKLSTEHAEAMKGTTDLLAEVRTFLKLQIEREQSDQGLPPRRVGGGHI